MEIRQGSFLNAVRFFGMEIGDRAKECFPKRHLERVFRDLTQYLLNKGGKRTVYATCGWGAQLMSSRRTDRSKLGCTGMCKDSFTG